MGKGNWLEGADEQSMVCAIHVGLGSMPSLQALVGIPSVAGGSAEEQAGDGLTLADGTQPGASEASLMMNLLHQAVVDPSMASGGVYVGEGLAPVPQKVAERIWRWEYIETGELLPEFRGTTREGKPSPTQRKTRMVSDIFT